MRSITALAALIGAATGLRSTGGFAILATSDAAPEGSAFRSPLLRGLIVAAAAGEAFVDKVARLPARTEPAPLAGRAAMGAAAAGIAAHWMGEDTSGPALVGASVAMATAWAATSVREAFARRYLPDEWPALAEDAVVVGLGKAAHGALEDVGY